MKRKPYPSDLTDEQWAIVEGLIPPAKPGGCPRKHDLREVLNALFYHNREGCSWRAIPHDFGIPWKTVYNYFRTWITNGTWDQLVDELRPRIRTAAGRHPEPQTAYIDSQSVKTVHGGEQRGYDSGKKVQGRKRHITVDSLGLLLAVVVTAAQVDDARAAQNLFEEMPGGAVTHGSGWCGETPSTTTTSWRIGCRSIVGPTGSPWSAARRIPRGG